MVFTFVSERCAAITMRCVSTVSTSARMLRSPAATSASTRSASEVRYTPGQIVVAAVPGQHHVDAQLRSALRELVDQLGGHERHVDRADEGPARSRRRPQPAGHARSPAAARLRDLVAQHVGLQIRQWLARCGDDEHRRASGDSRRTRCARRRSCRRYGKVALSRPIRRDAPPASTTAASGTGDVTCSEISRRSRCLCRAAATAVPPCRAAWRRGPRRPVDGRASS